MGKVSINELTLTNIGAAIREKTGKSDLIAPGDMPAEIRSIVSGGGGSDVEPIVLTGDCSYACAGSLGGQYIDNFGNTVSTKDITNANYMFYNSTAKHIPFQINVKQNTSINLQGLFTESDLEEVPIVSKAKPLVLDQLFRNCTYLRSIPEGFANDWDFTVLNADTSNKHQAIFQGCVSLRTIPESFLNQLWTPTTARNNIIYLYMFNSCHCLDEVIGLGVSTGAFTANALDSTFDQCNRLKNFTFAINEDGTPKTASWSKQTLDLSYYVGYVMSSSYKIYITNYNSGITGDKEVKDDATYQALKNDPDWFTLNEAYSRYNKESAVRTINSLPDTSATGNNTIKFKGTSGSATDGGAINTMTEEVIAVAAAKGWTVAFA